MSARPTPPELSVVQRIPSGSNAVFRCVDPEGDSWVYKPSAGERPLVDFPAGSLAPREVAAFEVSAALGWDLVPETVEASGPGGPGMAQRWIEEPSTGVRVGPDPVDVHPLSDVPDDRVAVLRGEGAGGEEVVVAHAVTPRIRRAALFDLVINNADRKGGHLLVDSDGEVWAIDHGLAFHTEPKLRTVLWGWAGTPLPDEDRAGLDSVLSDLSGSGALHRRLTALLAHEEIEALAARVESIIDDGEFPGPGPGYPLPWPLF